MIKTIKNIDLSWKMLIFALLTSISWILPIICPKYIPQSDNILDIIQTIIVACSCILWILFCVTFYFEFLD